MRCPGGGWAALYAPVFAVGLACSSPERAEAPALPDCEGPLCQPRQADPGGGSGSPADGSAPPGDAAESGSGTITLTVAVTSTTDSAFVAVQPYAAPVLLRLEQADGQQSSTGDTPVLSPASLQASPGVNWLAVIGAGPVRVIAPTLQAVTVDGAAPTRSVRALSWDTLTTLAVDDQLWTPQVGTATVLLVFRRAGMPVRGVTVLTPPGASVAYFESESRYVTVSPTTESESTVLVRDIGRLPAFPTLTSVTLQYQVGANLALLPIRVAPDFVTWVRVDVP